MRAFINRDYQKWMNAWKERNFHFENFLLIFVLQGTNKVSIPNGPKYTKKKKICLTKKS